MSRDKSGMPADPANLQAFQFHSFEYKCSRKGAAASKSLHRFLAQTGLHGFINSNRMCTGTPCNRILEYFHLGSPRREGRRVFFFFQIFKEGIGFGSNSENFNTRYPSIYPFHIPWPYPFRCQYWFWVILYEMSGSCICWSPVDNRPDQQDNLSACT